MHFLRADDGTSDLGTIASHVAGTLCTKLTFGKMHLETSSNLYGETVNPFNRKLTAGGSSGGEGALIGLRGSLLGIGSDIGGSKNSRLFKLRACSIEITSL